MLLSSLIFISLASAVLSEYNCYSCIYNPGADDSCITDPANDVFGTIVRCGHEDYVCRVQRIFDKGDKVLRNFYRGCEPRLGRKDNCVDDTHWNTCETFCESELCNTGNGMPATPPTKKPGNVGSTIQASFISILLTVFAMLVFLK